MSNREQLRQKAQGLLSQLTLDEKLSMMDGDMSFWLGLADMLGGGYGDHTWDAGVIDRLDIKGIRFADGPRGVVMDGATTFPVSMARGASWDSELEERIGNVIGLELKAMGGNLFGGVCINLLRHPAWGRAQETYGEDPHQLAEMGVALTRGVQNHVMACVKHYALNSMENARFKVNVTVSERALHEVYLPHFKRVVDEGVASVMSAYNSVNGEWCGQNKTLLTDILRDKWGFEGFVLTDFIFGLRDAKAAVLAGQDLEMPFQFHYHQHLKKLVDEGEVAEAQIDASVLRLLQEQLRFEGEAPDKALVACEAHRQLAREAAQKSIVLLQNNGVLPLQNLAENTQQVAVLGRLADLVNTGDGGSSNTRPDYVITPLAGLQTALEGQADVVHNDASELEQAVALAKEADIAILVVGYTHEEEGEYIAPDTLAEMVSSFPPPTAEEVPIAQGFAENMSGGEPAGFSPGGDRSSLRLRAEDEALIEAVAKVNPKTIVVVMSGSAVITESWRDSVAATLMLWYPGMEGGHALADVLLGNVNPSGKLPMVMPKEAADLPFFDKDATEISYDLWHGYRKLERDALAPAFPFGFGLSYTIYDYTDLSLDRALLSPSDMLKLRFKVTNSGAYAGEEVVQLYVSAQNSKVERAPKELKAFKRVALQAGETKTVELVLAVKDLAYYDETQHDFVVEATSYELFVAAHSLDNKALKASFEIKA